MQKVRLVNAKKDTKELLERSHVGKTAREALRALKRYIVRAI